MTRTWRLDDGMQTLVFAAAGDRLPAAIYWGPPLPEGEDLAALAAGAASDLTGGMLDALGPLSLLPDAAEAFQGQPGLVVAAGDGAPLTPRWRLREARGDVGAMTFVAADAELGLVYSARIATGPVGLLELSATLESDAPVRLGWLAAPVLPAPQLADDFIEVAGRWLGEFQLFRQPWTPGARLREARTGRSGHEHFPGALFPVRGATETAGEVYAFHYGWSGGHRMIAEELPDGRRQVQFGHAAGSERAAATRFATATALCNLQRCGPERRRGPLPAPPARPARPVARPGAAAAGALQLLGGGLFRPRPRRVCPRSPSARRRSGRSVSCSTTAGSAGATTTPRRSATGPWTGASGPTGSAPLIERVHACGMSFGLWVEPEMVNPDSDLYRAHPDWALGPADQMLGRHQLCLDLGRAEVRDHLFAALDALLAEHPIDYLKWDHNRLLPVSDAAQARGVYALLDRLRAAHPDVEIESCASGGGRIDFGILARTSRVWLSDSNDALERLRMQHDAALFLPAAVTGSHVGPRQCHSSGRVLPMSFRARVAAQRHLGLRDGPARADRGRGGHPRGGHRLVEGQPRLDDGGRHPPPRKRRSRGDRRDPGRPRRRALRGLRRPGDAVGADPAPPAAPRGAGPGGAIPRGAAQPGGRPAPEPRPERAEDWPAGADRPGPDGAGRADAAGLARDDVDAGGDAALSNPRGGADLALPHGVARVRL